MRTYRDWLTDTMNHLDQSTRELALSRVIQKLKEEGINPKDLDEEELGELVAHEAEKIKTFGAGTAVGLASMFVLDLLF